MEKMESSFMVGGNVNWFSHYQEQAAVSLKNLKIEQLIPYDPAIPPLVIYPEKRYMHPNVHSTTVYSS